jgi:hypothetical protein
MIQHVECGTGLAVSKHSIGGKGHSNYERESFGELLCEYSSSESFRRSK